MKINANTIQIILTTNPISLTKHKTQMLHIEDYKIII